MNQSDTDYDDFDRGYAQTDVDNHVLYFYPTDVHEFFAHPMEKIFKKTFPNWEIVKFDSYKGDNWKPMGAVKEAIIDGIDEYIDLARMSIRFDPPGGTFEKSDSLERLELLKKEIAQRLAGRYIVAKITRLGNSLLVKGTYEKYVVTPPENLRPGIRSNNFVVVPWTAKRSPAKRVVEGVEDTTRFGTYLWIYYPTYGLTIRKGHYAMHTTRFHDIINKRRMTGGFAPHFDSYDRGYLKLDPKTKSMYVMPTDVREHFTYDVKEAFEKEFPNWHIETFDKQRYDFKPGTKLLDAVKEGIRLAAKTIGYNYFNRKSEERGAALYVLVRKINYTLERRYIVADVETRDDVVYAVGSFERYKIELPLSLRPRLTVKDFKISVVSN
jgi:hypothetical protein